jgi:SecD/SecF fusion protein
MKVQYRWGIIVLTGLISLLSIYFLSFSFISSNVQKQAIEAASDASGNVDYAKKQRYLDSVWKEPVFNFLGKEYTYEEIKKNELQLGLDLLGGMHVVLEVSPNEIMKGMAGKNANDPKFIAALSQAEAKQSKSQTKFSQLFYDEFKAVAPGDKLSRLFATTSNRGRIEFNSTDEQVLKVLDEEIDGAIDRSFNILRTRIDKFGVVQPNIQRLKGTSRIQLELPGVDNPARVRKLLQGVAQLEFLECWSVDEFNPYFIKLNDYMVQEEKLNKSTISSLADTTNDLAALASTDTTKKTDLEKQLASDDTSKKSEVKKDSVPSNQSTTLASLFVPLGQNLGANVKDTARVNALLNREDIRALFPANMKFLWDVKALVTTDKKEYLALYPVKKGRDGKALLTGEVITDAQPSFEGGSPGVSMSMNSTGAQKWRKITAEASSREPKRNIAIVLDNLVYSAPTVQSEIPNGNSSISGSFTVDEAKDLANILKAGKLPAPTRIVEEAIVGPTLGQEAINQGLLSTLAGIVLVIIFMVMYYNRGGLVANIALVFNLFFILGVMAQFNSVLTLPGIAGIVLTIGMAVDANVLIFERIKEEWTKDRTYAQAISLGYDKAFWSIFDANVTTLLAGGILLYLGSGPVKGFAITLIIGIFCSFFTSIYITKIVISWLFNRKEPIELPFTTVISKNLFKNFHYDFIGKRKIAYAISTLIIVFGIACTYINGGLNYGVDFKGGRYYVVRFEEPVIASDIRSTILPGFQNAGTEVKTFGSSNQVKITTSYLIEQESTEADNAVRASLEDGLKKYGKSFEVMSSSKVGATIADDIMRTSLLSMVLAVIGIFLYVLVRFRNKEFGFGGVVALFHDAIIVIAIFSILHTFGLSFEIDQVFIAAILTIVGYSINDTVVIYDRIREVRTLQPELDLKTALNDSLNFTFSRTIMTAFTVLLVVLVLFIFGGEVMRGFSLAMLIGVISGSYSTIYIAVPIVLDFNSNKKVEELKA